MDIADILDVERVASASDLSSKKRVLQKLSQLLAQGDESLVEGEVFDALIARERLGSTGLGRGVALPHGRSAQGPRTLAAFLKLTSGVDYDAPDGEPVDLLLALLVPLECTDEHLQLLAQLGEMFSDPAFREKRRDREEDDGIYRLLANWKRRPAP